MAPSRYRSTGLLLRNDEPTSRRLTRSHSTMRQPARHFCLRSSHIENQSNMELELDLDNEIFIQSIEELLPGQAQTLGKSATPPPTSSSQISPITPGTPIKVERVSDSFDDIYDVSPQGYGNKSTNAGRRQTTRSTAQLTTPGSSPEPKGEQRSTVTGVKLVKSELVHDGDGRKSLFETSCTPPVSSPERQRFLKRPRSKALPTTLLQLPSKESQADINNHDRRESSSRTEGRLIPAILPPRPTIAKHNGLGRTAVPDPTVSTKKFNPQKNCKRPAPYESLGRVSPIKYPPILPPPKVRPSSSKTTVPTQGVMKTVPISPSTPNESPRPNKNNMEGKACCTVICSKCTSKEVLYELGHGPLGQPSGFSRLESVGACPSVSSFGPDDDIPPSNEMHQESGRAIAESARTFASNHISEISPSLKYNDLMARLGIHQDARSDNDEVSDVYEDFEEGSLPHKTPSRVIFGKTEKNAKNPRRKNVITSSQRACRIEEIGRKGDKSLQRIPSRSLRPFSATHDLSKRSENLDQESGLLDDKVPENDPIHESLGDRDRGEDEDSSSEYDEKSSRNAPAQAPLKTKTSGQGAKRVRKVMHDWPTFSDDDDVVIEDDVVEIGRDVFAVSENRRKKRHKGSPDENMRDSVLASPIPKEEPIEDIENTPLAALDCRPANSGSKNNSGHIEQERLLCAYYMNTYWDHGKASDGRRARDGFTSYPDFKDYCRKNKQPTDDRCILTYKKDLKHYLICEYHASLRQDLYRVAWNFEHNPGFSFKSCNKDEETRRIQNEAIGNAPSPCNSSSRPATVADGQVAELIAEVLKAIGVSHTADVAQLTKSKKKLESEVKGLKTRLARFQKR